MLDRTIPFYNIILKCECCQHQEVTLPTGFSIVTYEKGYEKAWAKLEYSVGDFDSLEEAERYFVQTYTRNQELTQNILFLLNENGSIVGSCIAWQDKRKDSFVASLHWLIVDEKYQGMGLGKALCCAAMNLFEKQQVFPIYIHTQPWSWKAVFLYLSVGFQLQKTDTFSHYENEYDKAMAELKRIVTTEQYEILREASES